VKERGQNSISGRHREALPSLPLSTREKKSVRVNPQEIRGGRRMNLSREKGKGENGVALRAGSLFQNPTRPTTSPHRPREKSRSPAPIRIEHHVPSRELNGTQSLVHVSCRPPKGLDGGTGTFLIMSRSHPSNCEKNKREWKISC